MKPCGVREGDRLADAFEEPQALGQVGHASELFSQRPALDALHHVEQPAVGQPAGVVDRHDARMFEPGEHACLALQPAFQCSRWPARWES